MHNSARLSYQSPFGWDRLLKFLGGRAIPGVEWVNAGSYRRTVELNDGKLVRRGWIEVTDNSKESAVHIKYAPSLSTVWSQILAGVTNLFDLNCDPDLVAKGLRSFEDYMGIEFDKSIRVPGCFEPWEMSVRAVLGQQVSVKSASTLAGRFAKHFGRPLPTPWPELNLLFPPPATIAKLPEPLSDIISPLGVTRMRATSLHHLSRAITEGSVVLEPGTDPHETMDRLQQLPGFGPWTASYVAMRALGWRDAFLHTDLGIKKSLPGLKPREILLLAEKWRPWRAYATMLLWR